MVCVGCGETLEDKAAIIIEYLLERDRLNNADVSFAMYVEKKFPEIWEKYTLIRGGQR